MPATDPIATAAVTSRTGEATDRVDAGRGRRERDVIAAFSELTTEAITAAKLEDLLRLVGRQLCHLLRVSRCSVYLRHDDGRFHGTAGYCESGDITPAVQAQEAGIEGDHFSREVISGQVPVLISDVRTDSRPHRRTMERWKVRAMLGVPLVFDGEVIGLMFVDNVQQAHTYTDDDVALAELFARLAALFIRQAMQGARLKNKAAEVVRQKNTLEYLADVHQKLTDAVLQGADIGAVVSLLAELSAKPVVLYDEDFGVVAWSAPAALTMSEPPVIAARIRGIESVRRTLDALSVTRPSAIVPPNLAVGLGRRHLMCRLIIEGAPSGFLGIVEIGRALNDLDTKLAERGATVLALQVLSERRQVEAEGQARDDFLSDLLRSSRDETQLVRRGPQFGIDLSEPHVLVRISLGGGEQQLGASASRGLIARRFAETLGTGEPPAVSLPGAVIVLVRLTQTAAEPEHLRSHVEAVVSSLSPRLRVRGAVVSAVCRRPEDFSTAHRELRELAELAGSFGWSREVLTVEELGLFRVVMNSGRVKEAVRFAHELVRPLRDRDGQLLETWREFVAAEGRVQRAARALGVHENTVRYRLGRIKEITGQDPASLDQLLAARLAFQVLDLAGW